MQAWYLIYSKPRQEKLALENLERQGYHAYLPMLNSRKRRAGKYSFVVEPMFPRYLFIRLSDQTDNWGPIRSTIGVGNLVRFGNLPGRVPDHLITALQENEGEAGYQELPAQELRAGDRVRVCEGPMAGYDAIFQCNSGKERVIVLLDIVSKSVRVQLSANDIELMRT